MPHVTPGAHVTCYPGAPITLIIIRNHFCSSHPSTSSTAIRSSVGPEQCLPSQVLAFRMGAPDEQDIMSARILQYLWHAECPECGSVGTHDGDCTRDWWLSGRGLFGDSPLFRGTELFGLTSLAKAILARETTETEDATRSGARLLPASAVRRPALQNLAP